MLWGLAILLVFQLLGELIVASLALPIPGPVVGMMLLFVALLVRGGPPASLTNAAKGLLNHLSLFFVPAGVGVVTYLTLIRKEWLPITVALVGSTLITLTVTALGMQALARVHRERQPHD